MKRLTIFTAGILLFVSGFFAGQYGAVAKKNAIENSVSLAVIAKPELFTEPNSSTQAAGFPTNPPLEKNQLPPHLTFTAEEKAQLAAQQREARQVGIKQLEEMIKSLKESKAPAEHIKHFQELKKAMETQSAQELPAPIN